MGRPENRNVEIVEQIGNGADVIFVTMGEHQAANLGTLLQHPIELRVNNVSSESCVRKGDAAVDEIDVVTLFERHAIHSDFPKATKRDDPKKRRSAHAC